MCSYQRNYLQGPLPFIALHLKVQNWKKQYMIYIPGNVHLNVRIVLKVRLCPLAV